MMESAVCGWDIGGAHLKAVCLDRSGQVVAATQLACPLWRGVEHLREAMAAVERQIQWHKHTCHAVTMTGELCDNFASRAAGVRTILDVILDVLEPGQTRVYAGTHGWCDALAAATIDPASIASANWHALAAAVSLSCSNAVVLDIGSTTTDIIPIIAGTPANRGDDDASRLAHDELVYTGVVRTPLMALCNSVPCDGAWQRVAAEYFATTADVYRILRQLPVHADLHDTADGAAKTFAASAVRLSRMLGRDRLTDRQAEQVAGYFAYRQFDLLQRALLAVFGRTEAPPEILVVAGVGEFLGRRLASFNALDCATFAALLDVDPRHHESVGASAPAAAVAHLALADR